MRLLHASRLEIENFIVDEGLPPYAILSHTWGEEEVSFQDWQNTWFPGWSRKGGYLKIQHCCEQALRDGLEWVWVDTCCIDKTSSAELSESINSMFRWYKKSYVCYAYLSDVSKVYGDSSSKSEGELSRSRWFTRGWTLQELIAPTDVRFYSKDWVFLGSKFGLRKCLYSITTIEPKYLDSNNLELASVAKKMSWAASRKTSRTEDIAYSLLGLFDINMPLIYGEGKKAFRRLQEEIIKATPEDHTIFAWGTIVPRSSMEVTDEDYLYGDKPIPWAKHKPFMGLLAESPEAFASSSRFVPSRRAAAFYRSRSGNVAMPLPIGPGIRIQLPVISAFPSMYHWNWPRITQIRTALRAVLFCCDEQHPTSLIRVPLQQWGDRLYGRTEELLFEKMELHQSVLFDKARLLHIVPEKQRTLRSGDILLRRHEFDETMHSHAGFALKPGIEEFDDDGVLQLNDQVHGRFITLQHRLDEVKENHGFGLSLGRTSDPASHGAFTIALVPIIFDKEQRSVTRGGIEWHSSKYSGIRKPLYHRVMKAPLDTWILDAAPFPRIKIKVERAQLEEDEFIDVLDIVIYSKTEQMTSRGRVEPLYTVAIRNDRNENKTFVTGMSKTEKN